MTAFHREIITCPHCLNEEEIPIWDSIDAQMDPDPKEKILLKQIQNYECQNCNHQYILEKPFLFIDRKERMILYYNPLLLRSEEFQNRAKDGRIQEAIQESMPQDFGFSLEDFSLRLVTRYNEVIEKIHTHDNGFLDRIMEIVKLAVSAHLEEEAKASSQSSSTKEETMGASDHEGDLFFLGEEENKLLFQVFTKEGQWRQVEVDPSVYAQAYNLMAKYLPEEGKWDMVDKQYALVFSQYAAQEIAKGM